MTEELTALAHEIAKDNSLKGFTTTWDSAPTKLALAAGELVGEALEVLREGDPSSSIRHRDAFAEELADAIIRCLDIAGQLDLDIGLAIDKKLKKNKSRPFRHGKRF